VPKEKPQRSLGDVPGSDGLAAVCRCCFNCCARTQRPAKWNFSNWFHAYERPQRARPPFVYRHMPVIGQSPAMTKVNSRISKTKIRFGRFQICSKLAVARTPVSSAPQGTRNPIARPAPRWHLDLGMPVEVTALQMPPVYDHGRHPWATSGRRDPTNGLAYRLDHFPGSGKAGPSGDA
jgi:hypothetical protein